MNLYPKERLIKLPHYNVINGNMYFMNFRKKDFTQSMIETFMKLDLVEIWSNIFEKNINLEEVERLIEAKCLIRCREEQTCNQRKIIVVSPHIDDAAFAIGGIIAKYKNDFEFLIVDIFSEQNYTLYWDKFINSRDKKYLLEEERIFWKAAGVEGEMLGYLDAPLRKQYQNKKVINSLLSTEEIIHTEELLVDNIKCDIEAIIKKYNPNYIFCPIGNGLHVDHIIVREACMKIKLNKVNMLFYEDMPYSVSMKNSDFFRKYKNINGFRFKEIDISDVIEEKKTYLSIYQSQLKKYQINIMLNYNNQKETIWYML